MDCEWESIWDGEHDQHGEHGEHGQCIFCDGAQSEACLICARLSVQHRREEADRLQQRVRGEIAEAEAILHKIITERREIIESMAVIGPRTRAMLMRTYEMEDKLKAIIQTRSDFLTEAREISMKLDCLNSL